MSDFVSALNERRGEKTLGQYAEDIGISISVLSRILRGQSGVSSPILRKIFLAHPDLFPIWLNDSADVLTIGAAA